MLGGGRRPCVYLTHPPRNLCSELKLIKWANVRLTCGHRQGLVRTTAPQTLRAEGPRMGDLVVNMWATVFKDFEDPLGSRERD